MTPISTSITVKGWLLKGGFKKSLFGAVKGLHNALSKELQGSSLEALFLGASRDYVKTLSKKFQEVPFRGASSDFLKTLGRVFTKPPGSF